jgi:hypothetical protein
VLLVACLHFVPAADDPAGIVSRYRAAMTAGGYVGLSHFTGDGRQTGDSTKSMQWYQQTTTPVVTRSAAELREILTGMELVEPGLVWTPQWRPDSVDAPLEKVEDSAMYAAIGRVAEQHGHRDGA